MEPYVIIFVFCIFCVVTLFLNVILSEDIPKERCTKHTWVIGKNDKLTCTECGYRANEEN